MSAGMLAFLRRVVAVVLTIGVIALTPLGSWPLGAGSEAEYWLRFVIGIVLMLAIAGVIFMIIVGVSFKRGVGEWIIINLALAGLMAVLFPGFFEQVMRFTG